MPPAARPLRYNTAAGDSEEARYAAFRAAYFGPSRTSIDSSATLCGNSMGDTHGVRLSNFSTEADERDVRELCGGFGQIARVHIARDRDTGEPRGVVYLDFRSRACAKAAVAALNGYGYDHLIIQCVHTKPKPRG